ncbi:hypothetical protein DOTSEDRAFT_26294 [Dothistroma septosporum NZE10]|uniref:BTB domain-containing protein n=1 Tax=Dothistroma septosporum (strain NZE10 / CBS 128990) TaxID=675120 RepID=N1PK24_DOTSN|nr:hypothetical protein DOTSEDRAFT_26294 [Dothistroma septosporum NZE10]
MPTSALPRLLESGEHSDLIIRTATRDFHVHKCIVSNRSAFFKGANRGHFKESHNGIIKVEERSEVIAALLQHIYEGPLDFVPRKGMSKSELQEMATMENAQLAIDLHTAADKYLVHGLARDMTKVIILAFTCLEPTNPQQLQAGVQVMVNILQKEFKAEIYAQVYVLVRLSGYAKMIMADRDSWLLLIANESHAQAFIECSLHFPDEALTDSVDAQEAEKMEKKFRDMVFEKICLFCDARLGTRAYILAEAQQEVGAEMLDLFGNH